MGAIVVDSEAHWHELRRNHVGSSEVAALFGMSPHTTRWTLYQQKIGALPQVDLSEDKAVQIGKHFEPAIASFAQDRFGLTLRKVHRYLQCDDVPAMGASLDYEATGSGTLIPVEIKHSLFGHGWDWEGDTITEAPEHYLLQVQHQLACTTAPHAILIAYVQGDVRRMVIERRNAIISALKSEVEGFWSDVQARKEPPVDFTMDADAIAALSALKPVAAADFSGDEAFVALCRRRVKAARLEARMEEIKKAAGAEITMRLMEEARLRGMTGGDVKAIAVAGPYRVTSSFVAATSGTQVTQDMVGTFIGQRTAYRRMSVSLPKPKDKK